MSVEPDRVDDPHDPELEAVRAKYREERDKRLRADANAQYRSVRDYFADWLDDPYGDAHLEREPIDTECDVVLIGGGIGALNMAGRLREKGITDICVIEKASDFGGTWYWNRYPGAMCDVEAYMYLPLLEETGFIPSQKYILSTEIREYLQSLARILNLYEKAALGTAVEGAVWDDASGRWQVTTDRRDLFRARFLVIPTGTLLQPKLPGIPGIEDFKGHSFHTSRWDFDYTGGDINGNLDKLKDKRVGIIGTGATAIQCIPHLAASAQQLYVFQRTPSAVDIRANRPTDPAFADECAPGWQDRRRENFASILAGMDVETDLVNDGWTGMFRDLTSAKLLKQNPNMPSSERARILELQDLMVMDRIRDRVDAVVEDPATAELLKPWYGRWCKRPCFHDEYLPAFNNPNVTLVDTNGLGPERITESSVIVDGKGYEVDCLVFATGFEVGTSYASRVGFDVKGRTGELLSEKWSQGPKTLHGVECHGFPNLFFTNTQHAPRTANYTHLAEEQSRHVSYIISRARELGANVIEVSAEAEQAWGAEVAKGARRGARYRAECTPGFYNGEGRPDDPNQFYAGTYVGGPIEFFALIKAWRDCGDLPGLELRT